MPEKAPSQALGDSSFLLGGVEGTLPILGNQVSGACLTTKGKQYKENSLSTKLTIDKSKKCVNNLININSTGNKEMIER